MGSPLDDFLKSLTEIENEYGESSISGTLKNLASDYESLAEQVEQSLIEKQRKERELRLNILDL